MASLCDAEDGTQDSVQARHWLYQWSLTSNPDHLLSESSWMLLSKPFPGLDLDFLCKKMRGCWAAAEMWHILNGDFYSGTCKDMELGPWGNKIARGQELHFLKWEVSG